MAQVVCCRSDLWRDCRKKRIVAEGTLEALRAWNDAGELEQCPREDSFIDLYRSLGDVDAHEAIRKRDKGKTHCSLLRKDPNACDCLPKGFEDDGVKAGEVCPNNVYMTRPEVFIHRDEVMDAVERLMRLIAAASHGILIELELDPLTATELFTAKYELDRQMNEKQKQEYERARAQSEAQANQKGINQNYLDIPPGARSL